MLIKVFPSIEVIAALTGFCMEDDNRQNLAKMRGVLEFMTDQELSIWSMPRAGHEATELVKKDYPEIELTINDIDAAFAVAKQNGDIHDDVPFVRDWKKLREKFIERHGPFMRVSQFNFKPRSFFEELAYMEKHLL